MKWLAAQKERLQELFAEFGTVAIVTYFVIFFGTWAGFWWAIGQGYQPDGAAGEMGRIGGSYAATKLTQPVRIAVTLVVTPIIGAVVHKVRGSRPAEPGDLERPGGEDGNGEVVFEAGGEQLDDRADRPAQ